MAKPTGGLLAFSARGSVAKTITFAAWRGRQYVRQHVIPANPRSIAQQDTRNAFSFLSALWKVLAIEVTQSYTLAAKGQPITDRNLFIKQNLSGMRSQTDLQNLVLMTAAKGGIGAPDTALVLTSPAPTTVHAVLTPPAAPFGWTLDSVTFAGFDNNGAPNPLSVPVVTVVSDASSAYTADFTGLTTGRNYQVYAQCVWTKPDGFPAYGQPAGQIETVS